MEVINSLIECILVGIKIDGGRIMAATYEEIKGWLDEGRKRKDITHMIVVCDTWDHEDYPVYVAKSEEVRVKYEEYCGKDMQKVMEVYSYNRPLETQLQETRSFHFD